MNGVAWICEAVRWPANRPPFRWRCRQGNGARDRSCVRCGAARPPR